MTKTHSDKEKTDSTNKKTPINTPHSPKTTPTLIMDLIVAAVVNQNPRTSLANFHRTKRGRSEEGRGQYVALSAAAIEMRDKLE